MNSLPHGLSPSQRTSEFQNRLLAWYDSQARELPWRTTQDPYRVWVSEIMLQQTRVAAVIERYHEFLRRFPNLQKLAAARESSVLAAWSGLGYYRRARMLHTASKLVARELKGKFPRTAAEWRLLPGVGRYSSAAIASIAFNQPVAVVDGNVERVIQRIAGQRLPAERLWTTAEAWLDRDRPGDFNQAMMELGATVCTPRAPVCLVCPVSHLCATRGELPSKVRTAPQKKREIHYALHCRTSPGARGQLFLVRRPQHASLMAGMWELPEIPAPPRDAQPLFAVRHSITVTDYKVLVWPANGSTPSQGKWVPPDRLAKLPITGLTRKILRKAGMLITRGSSSQALASKSSIVSSNDSKPSR